MTRVKSAIRQRVPQLHWAKLRVAKRLAITIHRSMMRPLRRPQLRQALREVQEVAPALPSPETIVKLIRAWDNSAAAEPDYLLAVLKHGRDAAGPILECGSGLTTIALAVYAQQPVISLENHPGWYRRVADEMSSLGLAATGLLHCPLKDYGSFTWYDPPLSALPKSFSLVVCDGPPLRDRPGGRVGLMPVMGNRLQAGALVLVDSDMQVGERNAIDAWRSGHGLGRSSHEGTTLVLQNTHLQHQAH